MSTKKLRTEAIAAFGRFIATDNGRMHLADNGYAGENMIIAHHEESIGGVFSRIDAHGGFPVALGVHFPTRPTPFLFAHIYDGVKQPGSDSAIGTYIDAVYNAQAASRAVSSGADPNVKLFALT